MYHYYHVSAQGIDECVINVHSSSSSSSSCHYKQIHDLFTKCANLVQTSTLSVFFPPYYYKYLQGSQTKLACSRIALKINLH